MSQESIESQSGTGPDWGQLLFVTIIIFTLSLTAAIIPTIGGSGWLDGAQPDADGRVDAATDTGENQVGPSGDGNTVSDGGEPAGDGDRPDTDGGTEIGVSDAGEERDTGVPDANGTSGQFSNEDHESERGVVGEDNLSARTGENGDPSGENTTDVLGENGGDGSSGDTGSERGIPGEDDIGDGVPSEDDIDDERMWRGDRGNSSRLNAVEGGDSDGRGDIINGTESDSGDDNVGSDAVDNGTGFESVNESTGFGGVDNSTDLEGINDSTARNGTSAFEDSNDSTVLEGANNSTAFENSNDSTGPDSIDDRTGNTGGPIENGERPTGNDFDGAPNTANSDAVGNTRTIERNASRYEIAVGSSPVPGTEIPVVVTEDSEPVVGATVSFNGEVIGTTDDEGRATGTVPYVTELAISVDARSPGSRTASVSGQVGSSTRLHAPATGPLTDNETQTVITVDSDTEIEIDGEPAAGETVTVTATVGGVPIPQGTTIVDGESQGQTDDDGTAQVRLPDQSGSVPIAVERGEIRATQTVDIRDLSLEVTSVLPLPGRSVDVVLEHGDEPVTDAPIAVDGAAATESGPNGTATVELPLTNEAAISAQTDTRTVETTVSGLYRNAVLVGLLAIGGMAGIGLLVRRFGPGRAAIKSLPAVLTALVQRAGRVLRRLGTRPVDAIVRLARLLERLGGWLADRYHTVASSLIRAGRWLWTLPKRLLTTGGSALVALDPRRLIRWLWAVCRALFSTARAEASVPASASESAPDEAATATDSTITFRDLWATFVGLVSPPTVRTTTAGELGRYAIRRGFPNKPVETVVETFRDVEYGGSEPTPGRFERVHDAVTSLIDHPAVDSGAEHESLRNADQDRSAATAAGPPNRDDRDRHADGDRS